MSKSSKDLGNNRFRESFGRYFEEFEVGHVYEHRPGRTITESDNTWFTLLTIILTKSMVRQQNLGKI
jgi:hypothetical protein